jgi:hypothetical protein
MNIDKVYIEISNETESANVQKKLFKMGFSWASGDKHIRYTEHKFLILDDDGKNKYLTFGDDENYLKRRDYKKISVNGISRGYAYEY